MKIILTDKKIKLPEDPRPDLDLSYRLGWWDSKGNIYIYKPAFTRLQVVGFVVHEAFEYFLVKKLGCREANPWPHRFSCILEMIVTIGQAWRVLYWR